MTKEKQGIRPLVCRRPGWPSFPKNRDSGQPMAEFPCPLRIHSGTVPRPLRGLARWHEAAMVFVARRKDIVQAVLKRISEDRFFSQLSSAIFNIFQPGNKSVLWGFSRASFTAMDGKWSTNHQKCIRRQWRSAMTQRANSDPNSIPNSN